VTPSIDIPRFRAELEAMDFEQPRALEEVLSWSIERMEHGIVQMSNPRYFGLFNPGASFPAQCADRIIGAFNPATGKLGVLSDAGGARELPDPRGGAARRHGRERHRAFRHGRIGSELYGAHLAR